MSLKDGQFFRRRRKRPAAVVCDNHRVLDSNTAHTSLVNSRFYGDDHARFELCLFLPAHTRGLMYFETESVPSGMDEQAIKAIAAQNLTRGAVNTSTQHSRFDCVNCCKLTLQNGTIHPPDFSSQLAYSKSSSHVAGVSSNTRTHIN